MVDDDSDKVLRWDADTKHLPFLQPVSYLFSNRSAPYGGRISYGTRLRLGHSQRRIQPVYAFVRSALIAEASSKTFVLCTWLLTTPTPTPASHPLLVCAIQTYTPSETSTTHTLCRATTTVLVPRETRPGTQEAREPVQDAHCRSSQLRSGAGRPYAGSHGRHGRQGDVERARARAAECVVGQVGGRGDEW
jgi:hypothetical protein